MPEALLTLEGVRKHFPVTRGLLFMKIYGWIRAVDGVSFSIHRGETFTLAGESGCGKSTLAKLILLVETPNAGVISFSGRDVHLMSVQDRQGYRHAVNAIFQDPYGSLNPRRRTGSIIAEPLATSTDLTDKQKKARVRELLSQVGLSPDATGLYPHEFSGGQRQRIALARALASKPSLLVLDEPVSALDVSVRTQILNLLKDLREQLGLSYLLITHHLATARYVSHRIAIMYLGKLVELAECDELYNNPLHPYTQALLAAALPSHPDLVRDEITLPGEVPSPINLPEGCRFQSRCPSAIPRCNEEEPKFREVTAGHSVACHCC